jgi:hypothetical protein
MKEVYKEMLEELAKESIDDVNKFFKQVYENFSNPNIETSIHESRANEKWPVVVHGTHIIDDPLHVVLAKPDFSDIGLSDEDRKIFENPNFSDLVIEVLTPEDHDRFKKQDRIIMLSVMLSQIKAAIKTFGENRSLGNVAANIETIIKNMEK